MSSGQKPRTSEFFPKMKVRGLHRRNRKDFSPPQRKVILECLDRLTEVFRDVSKTLSEIDFKRFTLLGGEDDPKADIPKIFKEV